MCYQGVKSNWGCGRVLRERVVTPIIFPRYRVKPKKVNILVYCMRVKYGRGDGINVLRWSLCS